MNYKKTLIPIFFALVISVAIQSCKKEDGGVAVNSGSSDSSQGAVSPGVETDSINSFSKFSIISPSGLINGSISDSNNTISVILPSDSTKLSDLVANFTSLAENVKVGNTPQVSGTTANDFSKGPVTYTVTAKNGTTRNYVVSITIAPATTKELTEFSINNVKADISIQKDINIQLPYGTTLNNLIAVFKTNGKSVDVEKVAQISGQTPNDFSRPVIYTVSAADGSSQKYTVRAVVALNNAKDISSLGLANYPSAQVQRIGNNFSIVLPYGTNISNLNVAFQTTGAKVMYNGAPLQSGSSFVNFTLSPVIFTVHAADGSTQEFYVSVTTQSVPATSDMLSFAINGVSANIVGDTISLTLPFGSSLADRVATFTTNGVSVKIGNVVQTSGQNINDFRGPVVYTVQAYDNTSKNYTVKVTNALNPEKAFNSFSISAAGGTVVGSISQSSIRVEGLHCDADLTKLSPTFTYSGKTVIAVTPSGQEMIQYSNNSSLDFTRPVTYLVKAQDDSTITYVVSVTKKTWSTETYKDGKSTKTRQVCR